MSVLERPEPRTGYPNGETCRSGLHPWVPENIAVSSTGIKRCKECKLANSRRNSKAFAARNPELIMLLNRKGALRRKGLTPERFEEMLVEAGYACESCKEGFSSENPPRIDHDHECCPGRISCGSCVRGLLCGGCNFGIGHFGDDISKLLKAVDYLASH